MEEITNYNKVNWKNYPIKDTPITAERLNHMDNQIYENQQKTKYLTIEDGKLCVIVEEED